jgi:hypothetical protein
MNFVLFIILVLLFVVLTPGVLVCLPPKSGKLVVALTHGLVFAIVWSLISKPLRRWTHSLTSGFHGLEGMSELEKDSKESKESKESNDDKKKSD